MSFDILDILELSEPFVQEVDDVDGHLCFSVTAQPMLKFSITSQPALNFEVRANPC